ncbi:hypothetical protein LCGC14_0403220 [marine sediment metagenome]|uniref:DUF72 domain-containing protein n=1 Tax=marine sediment metagenome TaxID=412755 RepID=A0A0F9SW38_9ZZZZ
MRHAAVRLIAPEHRGDWPDFWAFPDWACDLGTEEPTMKFWHVCFQGICGTRAIGWFQWLIPGWRDDWKDFRQRLAERAGKFGLTTVYIYNDPRPMARDMYDLVNEMNGAKNGA